MAVTSRHGDSYIWTRKQPVRATGTVGGRRRRSCAGWSTTPPATTRAAPTGAGARASARRRDGTPLAFNIVTGVHDAPSAASARSGSTAPRASCRPATFAEDLSTVDVPRRRRRLLAFAEEARRARADDFGLFASDYVQPFGTFSGTLPGGIVVARGWGVMERHSVRW